MTLPLTLLKKDQNGAHIDEFLLYLSSDKGCRPNSIKMYREDLEKLSEYWVTKDLLDASEKDIREYKYSLVEKGLAPRTINRKLAIIRSFYNYFVNSDQYELTQNPGRNIPSIKVPVTEPVVMNESQAETLLDGILLTGQFAARDYAIFSTFLFTGLRVAELIHLSIADVDFSNNVIHVRDGKGGKDRSIPMIPRLQNALRMYLHNGAVYDTRLVKGQRKTRTINHLAKNKCGRAYFEKYGVDNQSYLFLTKYGCGFTEKGIDYLFKQYTRNLGIYRKGLSLHALRRSCLTFLYKQGVDLFLLKEISGHVRVQTLEHYLHIDKTKVAQAMTKHPLADQGMDMRLVDLVRSVQ